MSKTITCSVEDAIMLLAHMKKDDVVTLTVLNTKTLKHDVPKKIKKQQGEFLIRKAKKIAYQDNDFFGRLTLYEIMKDNNIVHSILFPQQE